MKEDPSSLSDQRAGAESACHWRRAAELEVRMVRRSRAGSLQGSGRGGEGGESHSQVTQQGGRSKQEVLEAAWFAPAVKKGEEKTLWDGGRGWGLLGSYLRANFLVFLTASF